MPGEAENILAMEKFNTMLKSVDCRNGLSLTFKDDATFAYAKKVWDWVNGADNHTFVMVAGPGECGNNTNRIPFVVSSLKFDEEANNAQLTASKGEWKTVAHSYDLVVGNVPSGTLQRRVDVSKDLSIDASSQFPFSVSLGSGSLTAGLACTNCSTTGKFNMQLKASVHLFKDDELSVTVAPQDVSAIAQVKLTATADITGSLSKDFEIIKIPIDGITIPKILDLGPFLTVSVGAQLGPLQVTGGLQTGATAFFDNSAILKFDLLNPSNNQFSGWDPNIDTIPITVDGRISGAVSIFVKPEVSFEAKVFGKGFEFGLNLKAPNVNAKLELIEGMICPPRLAFATLYWYIC
jgi:hypothetical protein